MRVIAERTVVTPVTTRMELHDGTPLTRAQVVYDSRSAAEAEAERAAIKALLEPNEAFASAIRTRLIQLGQRPWAYPPTKPVEGE